MQDFIMERTFQKILDLYFDGSSHDLENLDKILWQFQLRYSELTGQEEPMSILYDEALAELDK